MPTRLGWGLLLLLGGVTFAALNTGNNLLYLLVGLCLAAMAVSFVAGGRALKRLDVDVSYPEEILAGELSALILVLGNRHARLGSPSLEVRTEGAARGTNLRVAPLEPGSSRTCFVPIQLLQRGLFPLGPVELTTSDPLGLTRRRRTIRPQGSYFVFPSPLPLADPENALAHQHGDAPARRVGEGLELHQMRDYQWSDDARSIDWRATARTGHLMVKEFLEANSEHLLLIFDPTVEKLDEETRRRFEKQVSLATAAVLRCAEERTPFRFMAPDTELLEVDPPGGHRPALEYLATIMPRTAQGSAPFAEDLDGLPGVIRLGLRRAAA